MRMRRAYWARLDGRKRVTRSLEERGKPGGSGEAGDEGSERGGGV